MTTKKTSAQAEFAPQDMMALAGVWGEAAREQYEATMKAFSESAEKIRAQSEESLSSTRAGFESANERLRAVGADALTAARAEMSEAVEFANNLARAKSVADALELQRNYWTGLFEARLDRVRAATEASVEATRDVFEPMNRTFASAFSMTPSFEKMFPFSTK